MKKPRKPFKRVIIKSRKITEPTVVPAAVEIKPCPIAYLDGIVDPDKSTMPPEWSKLPDLGWENKRWLVRGRLKKSKNQQYMDSWKAGI